MATSMLVATGTLVLTQRQDGVLLHHSCNVPVVLLDKERLVGGAQVPS